ncbi:class I SAM-dependent methyltransferase [Nibribacter koreensis]|uniref:Methyltransferase domain-containing protein n=1 Tax=Nibribacter koreensis TaxID=1084519 RepID=A0ABP8FI95_9BACT
MPQQRASPDFNLIAPVYDGLAQLVYGKAQQRAQQHFLSSIPQGARVLVVGGGTGWILTELLRTVQPAHILYVEASEKMLGKARARWHQGPNSASNLVEFRLGTEADLLPQEKFHVVMTPFVLDLFSTPEARQMMQKLNTHLLPDGLWLHTDFQVAQEMWRRLWQKPMLWGMYTFFGWVSHLSAQKLPPFKLLFNELGLVLEDEAFFYSRFLCAQKYRQPKA